MSLIRSTHRVPYDEDIEVKYDGSLPRVLCVYRRLLHSRKRAAYEDGIKQLHFLYGVEVHKFFKDTHFLPKGGRRKRGFVRKVDGNQLWYWISGEPHID